MKRMKGIYLASYTAEHPNYDIVYQDINGKRDISGDMLEVDLSPYDYVIATPPCNYWSIANYRRETSEYALKTKHLLPNIIRKLTDSNKYFIIENVRNKPLFLKEKCYDVKINMYVFGRHTYWTNIKLNLSNVVQIKDDIQNKSRNKRQGSTNVHNVIEQFLYQIHEEC